MPEKELIAALKHAVLALEAAMERQGGPNRVPAGPASYPASDNSAQVVDMNAESVEDSGIMSRVPVVGMTGEELVQRRKAAGLTQAQLAHVIGVSHRTITRWERGVSRLDTWKASEIRRVLFPDCVRDKAYMRGLVDKASRFDANVSTGQADADAAK